MLPQLPVAAGPAVVLRFIDVLAYGVIVLLLLRFATRAYYLHSFGVWTTALFNFTERLCRPLRRVLPGAWFGVRDYVPLVAAGLVVVAKPLLQAALVIGWIGEARGVGLILQWWALAVFYLSTGTQMLCLHAGYAGSALLFLAFCWRQAGSFWRPFALQVLDESTAAAFRRVAVLCRLQSPWPVLILTLLAFNLLCGVGASLVSLLGRLLLWPAWSALPQDLVQRIGDVAPRLLPAAVDVAAILVSFVFVPAMMMMQVLIVACFLFVILSWFQPNPGSLPFRLLFAIAGPPLLFIHRLVPWARIGMLDFSPILLFLALEVGINAILYLLAVVNALARAVS